MKRLLFILGVQVLAFWDVWHWYVARAFYSWDQPWGMLALIAALSLSSHRASRGRKPSARYYCLPSSCSFTRRRI